MTMRFIAVIFYLAAAVHTPVKAVGRRLAEQVAKLTAADAAEMDNFGWSLAIEGDTVLVGAIQWTGNKKGKVYVLRTTNGGATYDQVTILTASDGQNNDLFGYAVAIAGDTLVVGAPMDVGKAYVFRTSDGGATYVQVAKLEPSDGAINLWFGDCVAIDGDTIVAGAHGSPDHNGGANNGKGAAYVFRTSDGWNTYTEIKLMASDPGNKDYFGKSVAIAGDTIVAGAYGDYDDGTDCDPTSWPDFKDDVCGACKALVKWESYGSTCSGYCSGIGLTCVDGWEEEDNNCIAEEHLGCDGTVDSSDAICECSSSGRRRLSGGSGSAYVLHE